MTNHSEAHIRFRDAEAELHRARNLLALQDYAGATLHAQLCVELSAKTVVAFFEIPEHEHDCSPALFSLLVENDACIRDRLGEDMMTRLRRLGIDTNHIADWHGRATYGQHLPDGTRVAAADTVSECDAQWAVALAERSFPTVREFVEAWTATRDEV